MSLQLKCHIKGEDTVFLVIVECNSQVSQLKKSIQNEQALGILKDIAPHSLALWKPKNSNPIIAKPDHTLVERIGPDLSKIADKLDSSKALFRIFPKQPSSDHIHIIVKVPHTSELERISRLGVADEILPPPFPFRKFKYGDVIENLLLLMDVRGDG